MSGSADTADGERPLKRQLAHAGWLVLLAASLALSVGVWSASASRGVRARVAVTTLEQQATDAINQLRVSYGLHPLTFSPAMFQSAQAHCQQMIAGGYFGHASLTGATLATRIDEFYPVGNAEYYAVGENLLWSEGPVTSVQMVARWMQSTEHRLNMLNPAWRQIGLATVSSPSAPGFYDGMAVTVVTVDFGVRS